MSPTALTSGLRNLADTVYSIVVSVLVTMGSLYYVVLSTAVVIAATYLGSFHNDSVANVWFKIKLFAIGAGQMVLSQDRKWSKQDDPDLIKDADDLQFKQIIFIRHGESDWNEVSGAQLFVRYMIKIAH